MRRRSRSRRRSQTARQAKRGADAPPQRCQLPPGVAGEPPDRRALSRDAHRGPRQASARARALQPIGGGKRHRRRVPLERTARGERPAMGLVFGGGHAHPRLAGRLLVPVRRRSLRHRGRCPHVGLRRGHRPSCPRSSGTGTWPPSRTAASCSSTKSRTKREPSPRSDPEAGARTSPPPGFRPNKWRRSSSIPASHGRRPVRATIC